MAGPVGGQTRSDLVGLALFEDVSGAGVKRAMADGHEQQRDWHDHQQDHLWIAAQSANAQ